MKGSTVKRCSCPVEYDARGRRKACPKRHGSWSYVIDVGKVYDEEKRRWVRKQRKKGGFRTQSEAAAAMAEVLGEVDAGRYRDDRGLSLEAYLAAWLDNKAREVRPTTLSGYELYIRHYIRPHLGSHRLRELKPIHISTMNRKLVDSIGVKGKKLRPGTIRRIHACLRSALSDARLEGLVKHNAAVDAWVPREDAPKVRPWEVEDLGTFLDACGTHRYSAVFELMALTGLRRGEALGLRWDDVDLERGFLVVRQQLVSRKRGARVVKCSYCGEVHKGMAFGPPKTSSGEARRVDLGQRTIGLLLGHRLQQDTERAGFAEAYVDHGLVFAWEDGNPIDPNLVTKHFNKIVRATGLRKIRLHDLRHGRASMLLASGADISLVSKILGHSTITLTADTYSHLLAGVGRAAAEAADAQLPPRTRDQSVTNQPSEAPEGIDR